MIKKVRLKRTNRSANARFSYTEGSDPWSTHTLDPPLPDTAGFDCTGYQILRRRTMKDSSGTPISKIEVFSYNANGSFNAIAVTWDGTGAETNWDVTGNYILQVEETWGGKYSDAQGTIDPASICLKAGNNSVKGYYNGNGSLVLGQNKKPRPKSRGSNWQTDCTEPSISGWLGEPWRGKTWTRFEVPYWYLGQATPEVFQFWADDTDLEKSVNMILPSWYSATSLKASEQPTYALWPVNFGGRSGNHVFHDSSINFGGDQSAQPPGWGPNLATESTDSGYYAGVRWEEYANLKVLTDMLWTAPDGSAAINSDNASDNPEWTKCNGENSDRGWPNYWQGDSDNPQSGPQGKAYDYNNLAPWRISQHSFTGFIAGVEFHDPEGNHIDTSNTST